MECGDILAPTRRGVGVVAKDRPNLAPTWVLARPPTSARVKASFAVQPLSEASAAQATNDIFIASAVLLERLG
jgi:hypothetical protein